MSKADNHVSDQAVNTYYEPGGTISSVDNVKDALDRACSTEDDNVINGNMTVNGTIAATNYLNLPPSNTWADVYRYSSTGSPKWFESDGPYYYSWQSGSEYAFMANSVDGSDSLVVTSAIIPDAEMLYAAAVDSTEFRQDVSGDSRYTNQGINTIARTLYVAENEVNIWFFIDYADPTNAAKRGWYIEGGENPYFYLMREKSISNGSFVIDMSSLDDLPQQTISVYQGAPDYLSAYMRLSFYTNGNWDIRDVSPHIGGGGTILAYGSFNSGGPVGNYELYMPVVSDLGSFGDWSVDTNMDGTPVPLDQTRYYEVRAGSNVGTGFRRPVVQITDLSNPSGNIDSANPILRVNCQS